MGNEASPSMTIAIDDETAIDDNDTVATNNGISDEGTAVDGINDDIDNATPAVAAAALTSDLDVEAEIKPEEGIHESDADDQPQYGKNSATTIIDTDVPLDVVAVSPSSSSSARARVGVKTEDTSNGHEEMAASV